MLDEIIAKNKVLRDLKKQTHECENLYIYYSINNIANREGKRFMSSSNNKFNKIVEVHGIAKGIHPNPNITIANLPNRVLRNGIYKVVRYGLKHDIATKPKESDVFAFAEDIFDQINRKGLWKENLNSVQRIKNALIGFSFNVLDIDDK